MDPDHLTVVLPVAAGTCLKGVNLCIVLETADDVARVLQTQNYLLVGACCGIMLTYVDYGSSNQVFPGIL